MPLSAPQGRLSGYSSFEELLKDVNHQAKAEGFAIVKERTHLYKKTKLPRRYDLVCDRGGLCRASTSTGERQSTSRKTGCEWEARAVRRVQNLPLGVLPGRWLFEIHVDRHNHEPSLNPVAYPAYR